jgi:O-antigen ligase
MDTIFAHPATLAVIAGMILILVIGKIMKASFESIARWYLYLAVFSVIIVMNSIFFPFIGGKDYFLRFATELSFSSLVLYWAFEAKKGEIGKRVIELFHKPVVIAVTIFTAMFELACAFAYDPSAAFWSNYERGEGGFMVLHYYLFFLLLVFLFKTEKQWKNFFRLSLVAAVIMILYGVAGSLQLNGFIGPWAGSTTVPAHWWQKLLDNRFQGSLGNAAYVGAYLLFSMFYVGYLWTSDKIAHTLTKGKIWIYSLMLVVALVFFLLAATRGSFIGLLGGLFIGLLYVVFSSKGKVRKWGLVVLAIFLLLGVGLYAGRHTRFVQGLPAGRLLQISLKDPTAQTRLWDWGEAWQGFLERPLTGWGPANFTTVFDKFFNPKFYVPGQNSQTWFDRAHSIYFDYLAETGILGFLSYFGIFVVLFMWLHKKFKADEQAKNERAEGAGAKDAPTQTAIRRHSMALRLQRALIVAIPVAYLMQGIAIFDVFPMYISTFGIFAFIAYYVSTKGVSHELETHHDNG